MFHCLTTLYEYVELFQTYMTQLYHLNNVIVSMQLLFNAIIKTMVKIVSKNQYIPNM